MESTTKPPGQQSANHPPSVEIAYKRKCIALKKRLNEVESENEIMRLRNKRGWQYVQKMRLESCILLERLAKVTGMAEEAQAGVSPELRARAAGMMAGTAVLDGAAANGTGYYEDETEGSSDEQPPTVGSLSREKLICTDRHSSRKNGLFARNDLESRTRTKAPRRKLRRPTTPFRTTTVAALLPIPSPQRTATTPTTTTTSPAACPDHPDHPSRQDQDQTQAPGPRDTPQASPV